MDVRSNDAERHLAIPSNGHYRVMSIDRPNFLSFFVVVVVFFCFFLSLT